MKLKVLDLDIATGGACVVILSKRDARHYDIKTMDRLVIKYKNRRVIAVVDVAISEKLIPQGTIGVFEEVLQKLDARNNQIVEIDLAQKPAAVDLIRKKLDGTSLSATEIDTIIEEVVHDTLTDIELTFFVAACYAHGLTDKETINLTRSIVHHGSTLKLNKKIVVDKHCVGGVPGNRTTPIVVSIVASAGLAIPKTSSRAISSPAGTADTMEVLTNVTIDVKKMKSVVNKTNGCMVWGGGIKLAAADDRLIRVRHPVSLDPQGMLLASILAKKLAVHATHVAIDIPVGRDIKIKTKRQAEALGNRFTRIAKELGMKVSCYITDGTQPIGCGIGPALEARDVLQVLANDPRAPKDLRKKAIHIAGDIFRMAGVKGGESRARNILDSGRAYKKFQEIIEAQGGDPTIVAEKIRVGEYSYNVKSLATGTITWINNNSIGRIARVAGAPQDKGAGIYLYKHKGDRVKKGDTLFTIYAQNPQKLEFAKKILRTIDGITIE